ANIGQMTSLMRHRVGSKGRVIAFEPHPDLFSELQYNVEVLETTGVAAPVDLHNLAVSDRAGEALLDAGLSWSVNRGMSKLVAAAANDSHRMLAVRTATLDQMLDGCGTIGVCKIDVEGHELNVLKGATRLLEGRRLRD